MRPNLLPVHPPSCTFGIDCSGTGDPGMAIQKAYAINAQGGGVHGTVWGCTRAPHLVTILIQTTKVFCEECQAINLSKSRKEATEITYSIVD